MMPLSGPPEAEGEQLWSQSSAVPAGLAGSGFSDMAAH